MTACTQLIKVDGETTYNPYKSSVPEFKSNYSQSFVFDDIGLGNMTSKVSSESITPQKSIGDNLNYSFAYNYDENYAHRLINAGDRYYKYDANGNIICEQDGSFESNGEEVSYHKITKETEDVYSTDYGWGLFREDNSNTSPKGSKYFRTYAWNERNQLISSVDSSYNTAYVYGQDGQRSNKYTQNSETLYFNKMWTLHTDSGNNVYDGQTAKNIYLGDTRIVTKLNSGDEPTYNEEYYKQYYYHSDHLGSASLITDYKGDEYQRIEYTPYGETWVEKTSNTGLEWLPYKFTAKELDKETGLYYYGARYLDAKYSRWLSADPALGDYVSKTSKGEGGIYNSINLNLYHYSNNNPVKYTDPDGKFAVVPMLIGGAISAAVDYGFQVAGNYMQGKRGSDAWTDVNVGEIVGAFVSGALTTVGIGAVTKVAGTATTAAVRKGIQVAGNAAVSAAASVPGTITENAVNNLVNPDNKVALTENVKDNAIKSGISGGVVSALAKTPAMSVKTPKGYKPNNIPYKQVGPNKYVRKGPMPGSIQAGAVQLTKDVGGEIFGQGVSKEVSNIYDNIKNHKQPQNVENE